MSWLNKILECRCKVNEDDYNDGAKEKMRPSFPYSILPLSLGQSCPPLSISMDISLFGFQLSFPFLSSFLFQSFPYLWGLARGGLARFIKGLGSISLQLPTHSSYRLTPSLLSGRIGSIFLQLPMGSSCATPSRESNLLPQFTKHPFSSVRYFLDRIVGLHRNRIEENIKSPVGVSVSTECESNI